jgi:hypothetical protein
MSQLLLRLALLLTVGFVMYMLILHVQPYDSGDLHALTEPPEDCPAPCLLGIRPYSTTVDEALALLGSNPWIERIDARLTPNGSDEGTRVITWSGKQPTLIDTRADSLLSTCGDVVCGVSIPTTMELGTLLLAFGQPDSATIRSIPDGLSLMIVYTASYDGMQLTIRSAGICAPDFTEMALHHSRVILQVGDIPESLDIISLRSARFQTINFQKQFYPWLERRAYICDF